MMTWSVRGCLRPPCKPAEGRRATGDPKWSESLVTLAGHVPVKRPSIPCGVSTIACLTGAMATSFGGRATLYAPSSGDLWGGGDPLWDFTRPAARAQPAQPPPCLLNTLPSLGPRLLTQVSRDEGGTVTRCLPIPPTLSSPTALPPTLTFLPPPLLSFLPPPLLSPPAQLSQDEGGAVTLDCPNVEPGYLYPEEVMKGGEGRGQGDREGERVQKDMGKWGLGRYGTG